MTVRFTMISKRIVTIAIGGMGILAALAFGQPATPAQREGVVAKPIYKTMHLATRVGTCKIIDSEGRLEINFTGSLLISQLKGKHVMTGKFSKEYDDRGRVLYYGTGKAVITGEWRAVQFFGRDFSAVWFGRGVARVGGEYDKDLKTGETWYDDPSFKIAWPAQGLMEMRLPTNLPTTNGPEAKPIVPRRKPTT